MGRLFFTVKIIKHNKAQATWSEFSVGPTLSRSLDKRCPKASSNLSGLEKSWKLCISVHNSSLILFLYENFAYDLFEHSLTPDAIRLFSSFDIHHS